MPPEHEGSNDSRLSRRKFLAAGAAFGGAIVWSPSAFSKPFETAAATPKKKIKKLRKQVDASHISGDYKHTLTGYLDNAIADIDNSDPAGACQELQNFINFLQDHSSSISDPPRKDWIQAAKKIRQMLGCGATGPTGPTGPTGASA
jgi:hypothetical protein